MSVRRCRECGCLDEIACELDGRPCWWVGADLCSACAADAGPGWEHPPRALTDELAAPVRVIPLSPAVELREQAIGTAERRAIGAVVELALWRGPADEAWTLDVYGPERGRVRRFVLHTSIDVLALADREEEVAR